MWHCAVCMSKWADAPAVALVPVAPSDEPLRAGILCNSRGRAVSEKEIKWCAIDFKSGAGCLWAWEQKHTDLIWPQNVDRISLYWISKWAKQHVSFQSVQDGTQCTALNVRSCFCFVLLFCGRRSTRRSHGCCAAADSDEVDGDTPNMYRAGC